MYNAVVSCGAWHAHPRVWQALGQLQGLNSLQFRAADSTVLMLPSSVAHMSALASLASSLHTLVIDPPFKQLQQEEVVDYSALSSLSSLTCLSLPLAAERRGLSSISSCCQLQGLCLEFKGVTGAAQQVTLQPSELSALGRLTQLTGLLLDGTACGDHAGWSFFSRLRQLQQLSVKPVLPHTAVAALAHLTCLSQLTCGWEQHEGPPHANVRCAAVRELLVADGVPPLHAFPGLTSLMQFMPWEPAVLCSAAECCTQLEELRMYSKFGGSLVTERGSLPVSATAAARTAALSSLAALQHLQHLDVSVNDNAEVAAVAALQQVKRLVVVVPTRSSCSMQGLAVMAAAMKQLQHLTLQLSNGSRSTMQEADVQLLLCAVRHVRSVQFGVQERHVRGVDLAVRRARRALTEQGLPLAAQVVVMAIKE